MYIYIYYIYTYVYNQYIYICVCDVAEPPFTRRVDFKDEISAQKIIKRIEGWGTPMVVLVVVMMMIMMMMMMKPKRQIDEKMQQERSRNDEEIMKNRSPRVGKSWKMEARSAFQRQQNAKFRKIRDPPNGVAPWESVLVKNGSLDGGQNALKIDKKNRFKI